MSLRLLSRPYVKKMTWPLYFKKYEDLRLEVIIHVALEKLWAFYGGVHPTWKPDPPHPSRPKPPTTETDDQRQVPTLKIEHLWVSWQVSSPKTQATQPNYKIKKIWRYLKVFQRKFTKTGDVWSFPTKIYLKSTRSGEISTESGKISPNLVRSLPNLVEISSNLVRSQQTQWGLAGFDEDLAQI